MKIQHSSPGGRLNINMSPYRYRDFHDKVKTVSRHLNFVIKITIFGKTILLLRRGPRSVKYRAQSVVFGRNPISLSAAMQNYE